MDLGIAGKTALVTGGARSLGKQDALTLASEGCRVIVLDLNAEGAAETAKEIADAGGTARGYAADITDRAVLVEVIGRAEREVGPVDIIVNCAGTDVVKPFLETDELVALIDAARRQLEVFQARKSCVA